jgi:hypothetical protein
MGELVPGSERYEGHDESNHELHVRSPRLSAQPFNDGVENPALARKLVKGQQADAERNYGQGYEIGIHD